MQGDKKITLKAGEGGALRAEGVPLGKATLQVSAESFVSQSIDVSLEKGKALQTKIQMEPAIPPGQVRGLVRSFRGRGIAATIVILSKEGGDAVATVQAGKDGHFRVGVEPGSYEVSVEAAGYKSQKRKVRVEENGVTVLNVDLRGAR